MGDLLYILKPSRARVAATNLALCFPELDLLQQKKLLRKHLREVGIGFFETLLVWFGNSDKLADRFVVEGWEHLDSCRGRGVMILGFHFTNIELATVFLARTLPVVGVYRPHDNPLMEQIQSRGRLRGRKVMPDGQQACLQDRADVRTIVRMLKEGRFVWIAADQDLGKRRSVFAPFFGIDAATPVAPGKLAKLSSCAVLPVVFERQERGQYVLRFEPPLEGFPTGDDECDAGLYNQLLETLVKRRPHAYLWVHKRFKTRPPGVPAFY